jgi:RimJ/RimL family protein N-acetyltransferase
VRITRDAAKGYFAHPTQLRASMLASPDDLPDDGVEYWAHGPICGIFHRAFWPDVWMVHYGVMPEGWGHLVEPARAILAAFWKHHAPKRIIGWTDARNRAALALTRRVGFVEDGRMQVGDGEVVMTGWRA